MTGATTATAAAADRFAPARAVADAVLYEGYVLYPYRASAAKNRLRWQFGLLAPPATARMDPSERSSVRTECIVEAAGAAVFTVRVRFLQVQRRQVEAARDGGFVPVDRFDVDGRAVVGWEEAIEREVDVPPLALPSPTAHTAGTPRRACADRAFHFPGGDEIEVVWAADAAPAGRVVRHREAIDGRVTVAAGAVGTGGHLAKVTVTVDNTSAWRPSTSSARSEVLARSPAGTHTMLAVDGGVFLSQIDPPARAADAAAGCSNVGAFPVLVGSDDLVLSAPIILYDHPEVAPESPGDLYDATEIDEILALRVLTLTDEEKGEARATDARAAAVIDRCDQLGPEEWERLHGAVRALRPVLGPEPASGSPTPDAVPWWDPASEAMSDPRAATVEIGGVVVAQGSAVRLRPSRRADAHDLFLQGLDATVAGVFCDVDGNTHIAVTVDDDPATEELAWQGRYLYFHPDEIEVRTRGGT